MNQLLNRQQQAQNGQQQTLKRRGRGYCTGFQSSSNVDTKRIDELFRAYADDEGSTTIDIEGASQLGEVIGWRNS